MYQQLRAYIETYMNRAGRNRARERAEIFRSRNFVRNRTERTKGDRYDLRWEKMRSRELIKYGRADGNEEEREWLEVVGRGESTQGRRPS